MRIIIIAVVMILINAHSCNSTGQVNGMQLFITISAVILAVLFGGVKHENLME